jgi:SAM-dependent methyltransferase
MVNRRFTAPAIIAPDLPIWRTVLNGATFVPDTPVLDLAPGAHDLVVHVMSLHWADDPVGQVVQCRRALRPDGLCLVVSLGGRTLHELRASLAEAEAQVTGGLSPRVLPMADLRDMGAVLQRSGLALPVADSVSLTAEYRDLWHLMADLRHMGEANALDGRLRRPTRRALFDRAAEIYADRFATGTGRLPATFEIVCLTGWAPDASQPKPLRPGSARTRLADALGTNEIRLPD